MHRVSARMMIMVVWMVIMIGMVMIMSSWVSPLWMAMIGFVMGWYSRIMIGWLYRR